MRCRRLVPWLVVLAGLSVVSAPGGRAADDKDVVGTWKLKFEPGDATTHEADVTVNRDKAGLKAVYTEGARKVTAKDVSYKDGVFRFTIDTPFDGAASSSTFSGKVKGAAVEGDCKWTYQGMSGSFKFTGARQAARPEK
jgi:hypothetical protein